MFRPDWHEDDRAKPLVRQYQAALDSVLQSHPELQRCVVCCAHCGIRFLTHPRNAGRRDLRCPFGCREHHRREQARQRSAAFYQTSEGRRAKKRLNGRRSGSAGSAGRPPQPDVDPQRASLDTPTTGELPGRVELRLGAVVLDDSSLRNARTLPYLRMIVSLIEGVGLTRRELVNLLRRAMRQHSIGDPARSGYAWCFPSPHPS